MSRLPIPDALEEGRLVAILRHVPDDHADGITEALIAGGVRALEVTMNSLDAVTSLRRLSATYGGRLLIGAGTIIDARDAETAVASGAAFLVTPHVDAEVIAAATRLRVPVAAGATTPTEILTAWRAGASLVKLFPAASLGAGYVRDVRGPLENIPLLATGGVTVENGASFIAAGAWGIAAGGALVGSRGDPVDADQIVERASAFVRIAAAARR